MRTTDALKIGMALGRIGATLDAWEESKHPRRPDGKFGSGGGSSNASSSKSTNGKSGTGEKSSKKTSEKRPYEKLPNSIKRMADMIVEGIERDPVEYHKGKRTETVAKKYKEGKLSKEELQDEVTKLMLS